MAATGLDRWRARSGAVLLCALALLSGGCGPSDGAPADEAAYRSSRDQAAVPDSVRSALERMLARDQEVRGELSPETVQDTLFLKRMMRGDSTRTARLREILDWYGWPTAERVGPEAADAAFVLLQHSPDRELQRAWLPRLEELARAGSLPPSDVALLVDRVLVGEGRPQRYGTQFSVEDGTLVMDPVEDEEGLSARRREMGLPPMDEYVRALEERFGGSP